MIDPGEAERVFREYATKKSGYSRPIVYPWDTNEIKELGLALCDEVQTLRWWQEHGQKLRNAIAEMDGAVSSDQEIENAPYKAKKIIQTLRELVGMQKEYIKLLHEELTEAVNIAAVHHWVSTRYEKSEELRTKIAELEEETG